MQNRKSVTVASSTVVAISVCEEIVKLVFGINATLQDAIIHFTSKTDFCPVEVKFRIHDWEKNKVDSPKLAITANFTMIKHSESLWSLAKEPVWIECLTLVAQLDAHHGRPMKVLRNDF